MRDVRAHCHRVGTAGPGNWTLFWPDGCSGQLEVRGGMSGPTVTGLELRALATGRCSGQQEVRGGMSGPTVTGLEL